jgi:hypothetical protein
MVLNVILNIEKLPKYVEMCELERLAPGIRTSYE